MRTPLLLSCGIALLATSLAAQTTLRYTIAQTKGTDTFGAKSTGQTFTPNVGIVPSPGSPTMMPLEMVTLYHGNATPFAPSATTFLNIYDGDPNGTGKFIGSSDNSVDTRSLKFHDPMVWQFSKLQLAYTVKHWAVMSSTNVAGNLDVAVPLETEPRAGDSYSGGAGLIANIVEHQNGVDAKFAFEFFTGVQGNFNVSNTGCASSVGVPTLDAPLRPQVGRAFPIEFGNLATGGVLIVFLGASDTTWATLPLPLPMARLIGGSDPTCFLYTSIDVMLAVPTTSSTFTLPLTLPNDTNLFGNVVFTQGCQFESTLRLSMTPKGRIFIGQ